MNPYFLLWGQEVCLRVRGKRLPYIYPFFSQYTIKGSSSPLTPPNVTLTLNDNSKEFNSLRVTEKSYQSYLYFKIVDFKCMLFIVDAVRYGALSRAF